MGAIWLARARVLHLERNLAPQRQFHIDAHRILLHPFFYDSMTRILRAVGFTAFLLSALLIGIRTAHAQTPTDGFLAAYYNGRNLQGAPLLSRIEPVVNWSYPAGESPAPGTVPATEFSTRWEGWYNMPESGAWTIFFTSDDGGRVWIDNELVVDLWYDHAPMTRAKTKQFAAGYHLVRVEYYQGGGGMTAQLQFAPPGAFPDWMGEYFDNPYLLGAPRARVNDAEINFNWGEASPDARLPADNFSARWTRLYNFAPGNYTFTATADDGIRVWVGDTLAIDAWVPQQPQTYERTLYVNGSVPLRVEYFEQGGNAVVNFFIKPATQAPDAPGDETWRGTWYNNATLTPPAVCEENAAQLQFNWNGNSPACGIGGQFFSARWDATRETTTAGFYTVHVLTDDGARVFIDDALILDAWREQAPTAYSTTVYLEQGAHEWRVEYFQGAGGAQIALDLAPGVAAVTPPSPPPTREIVVDAQGAGWTQGGSDAAWHTASNGHGGSALWTNNNAFLQPFYNWGRWYPPLTHARNYQVEVFIPANVATTQNARYTIYHNGQTDSVTLPQAQYRDQWVSLGAFAFAGQGGEYVALSDVTYECFGCTKIVWDAVKFTPQ